jgi:hypothetical protein
MKKDEQPVKKLTEKEMAIANKIVETLKDYSPEDQLKVIRSVCILHDIEMEFTVAKYKYYGFFYKEYTYEESIGYSYHLGTITHTAIKSIQPAFLGKLNGIEIYFENSVRPIFTIEPIYFAINREHLNALVQSGILTY